MQLQSFGATHIVRSIRMCIAGAIIALPLASVVYGAANRFQGRSQEAGKHAALPPEISINRTRILNLTDVPTGWRGGSFKNLSRFLYGGDPSYAAELKTLNRGGAAEKFFAVEYRIQPGDTLNQIAFLWVNGELATAKDLRKMNPGLKNANRLKVGSRLLLPRVPLEKARRRWALLWQLQIGPAENIGVKGKAFDPGEIVEKKVRSPFAPINHTEARLMTEWNYSRSKDIEPTRLVEMLETLLDSESDWRDRYLAARIYRDLGDIEQSRKQIDLAVADPSAEIPVAALWVKLFPQDPRTESMVSRFPMLKALTQTQEGPTKIVEGSSDPGSLAPEKAPPDSSPIETIGEARGKSADSPPVQDIVQKGETLGAGRAPSATAHAPAVSDKSEKNPEEASKSSSIVPVSPPPPVAPPHVEEFDY